jgi:hypothetical protein
LREIGWEPGRGVIAHVEDALDIRSARDGFGAGADEGQPWGEHLRDADGGSQVCERVLG